MVYYLGKCLDYITVILLLEKSLEGLTMRLKLHYTSLTSRHDKHILITVSLTLNLIIHTADRKLTDAVLVSDQETTEPCLLAAVSSCWLAAKYNNNLVDSTTQEISYIGLERLHHKNFRCRPYCTHLVYTHTHTHSPFLHEKGLL